MINPRLDALTDYPFDRLRALLDGATPPPGREVLALSIGEPQGGMPAFAAEIVARARDGWGRYPPGPGTPDLREACAAWLTRRFALPEGCVSADRHVLAVAGTREALYMAAQLAVPARKAGRRPVVLIPNPFYQVYLGAAVMAGAEPLFYEDPGSLETIEPALLERVALVYLCNPSNPTGEVTDAKTLARLGALARTHDFVLAVDECYSEVYDGAAPPGALAACDADNVLVFHSLSKRSGAPGLRSGFVAGDPRLVRAFARLRAYGGAALPLPVQAASAALWADETHVETIRATHRRRLDIAQAHLGDRPGFVRPPGGFFLWLAVGDGERATLALWRDAAIRVLPGAYLAKTDENGHNPGRTRIRIALVHEPDVVERACGLIAKLV